MLSFSELGATTPQARDGTTFGFQKVLKYLSDRGVTRSMMEKAGISVFPVNALMNRVYSGGSKDDRLGVVFPHFDRDGEFIEWWSTRMIEVVEGEARGGGSFERLIGRKAKGKMLCPPGELIHAYYAPFTDWGSLKKGDSVYIHESVIKSLNGSRLGYYSIGLNGVYGFSSKKHRVELLSEFVDLPWKNLGLKCKIVFDSNAKDNSDVRRAIEMLAERMEKYCGVRPMHLLLPKREGEGEDGGDWGFDDACVAMGDKWAREFLNGEGEEIEVGEVSRMMNQLNEKVCVIRSLSRVAEIDTGTLMTKAAFTDLNYAAYTTIVPSGESVKSVNVAKLWLVDDGRREVERIDYIPGGEAVEDGALNTWKGLGLEPKRGEMQWWYDVLLNNMDAAMAQYVMCWLAYPIQNMGEKLNTYLYLYGMSGVGKNRLMLPLSRLYGKNFSTVTKEDLESNFNTPFLRKQLINVDELHGSRSTRSMVAQKIKRFVTGETLIANEKGVQQYELRNTANLIITSNYPDAVRLDDDDRRAVVIRFENITDRRRDREYWDEYTWEAENGGSAALLYELMNYDIKGFDPKAAALMTAEKAVVIEATRDDVEQWCRDLWEDPDSVLTMAHVGKCVFTAKELAVAYYHRAVEDISNREVDVLSKTLRNTGFVKANEGRQVKVKGMVERFWVVRNKGREWSSADVQTNLKGPI